MALVGLLGGAGAPLATAAPVGSVASGTSAPSRLPPRTVAVATRAGKSACQELVTRIVAELALDGTSVLVSTCVGSPGKCVAELPIPPAAFVMLDCPSPTMRRVEVRVRGAMAAAGSTDSPSPSTDARQLVDGGSASATAALAIRSTELVKAMLGDEAGAEPAVGPVAVGSEGGAPTDRSAPLTALVPAPLTPSAPSAVAGDANLSTTTGDSKPPKKNDVEPAAIAVAEPDRGKASVPPRGRRNLTVAFGAVVMGGFQNLRSAFGPSLEVGRRAGNHLLVSLVLAGPAFGGQQTVGGVPTLDRVSGVATVRHEMGLVQAQGVALTLNRIVLRGGVGVGLHHVHVEEEGSVSGNFVKGENGGYAAVGTAVVGAVLNLRSDIGVFVEGRVMVLTPTPVITMSGAEIGRIVNPWGAVAAGLELRL